MPPTTRSGAIQKRTSSQQQHRRSDGTDRNRVHKELAAFNETVLLPITNTLRRDAAADLSRLFARNVKEYSRRRDRYTKVASNEVLWAKKTARAQERKLREGAYKLPCPEGPMGIIRPLATQVMRLLGLPGDKAGAAKALSPQELETASARLLQAIEKGSLIWHLCGKFVVRLDENTVVKFASGMDIDDAAAIEHIYSHAPDMPVHEPYGVASIGPYNYVFMSFLEGVSLDKLWPSLTASLKNSIQLQLNTIMHRLRSLPLPPGPALGSGEPRRCKDMRRYPRICSDEICNEDAFNSFLTRPGREICGAWLEMVRSRLRDDHMMVMTHGDLRPANILVEQKAPDCIQIKGLVDWGSSGVYPSYWEYVKACNGLRASSKSDWFDYLPAEAIGRCVDEFMTDIMLDQIYT